MPLRAFNHALSKEAQEAVSIAFDAVDEWNKELATSTQNVAQKMATAARALGWPDAVVTAMTAHVESITQLHTHMMTHILDAWQVQMNTPHPMGNFPIAMFSKLQSWPGLTGTSGWPSIEAFGNLSQSQEHFWKQIGEQWQKNWAQALSVWSQFNALKK